MAIFTIASAVLASAGFTGAISIFGLSATASAAVIGVTRAVAFSQISRALAPKASRQQVQAVINQGIAPRVRGYGQVKLGGIRAFWEAKDGKLYMIVACHHGPLSGILGWDVDGTAAVFNGAGATVVEPFAGFLNVQAKIDAVAGGDWADVRSAFPALWTVDHDLKGLAAFRVVMTAPSAARLSKVFPRQDQTSVAMIAQASAVYDPRTGLTGYSANAALCIRDYLTHPDGARLPVSVIDDASVSQFASLSDEAVPRKAGGTEARYRVMGYYTLQDAPKDVIGRMTAACDATIYPTIDGKIGIMGGRWSVPDTAITADDILEMRMLRSTDPFTRFNVLKGTYTDPANGYQPTACAELRDEVALLTEPLRIEAFDADMCPSPAQMQRLMKIRRAKTQRRFTATLVTNLVGLKLRYPKGDGIHTTQLVLPELMIDEPVEVLSHDFDVAARTCKIEVGSIVNPYGWDAATEEGDLPAVISGLAVPVRTDSPPTGLVLTQEVVVLDLQSQAARVFAEVNPPVASGLQLELQIRSTAAGAEWQAMVVAFDALRGYSPFLNDAGTYQVRARWVGQQTWSATQTITVVANPTTPAVPTSFSHTFSAPNVTLTWVNGVSGFWRTRVFRSTTNDFGTAGFIAEVTGLAGQASSYVDAPSAGATYYYWIRTVNASQVASATVGPRSQTV